MCEKVTSDLQLETRFKFDQVLFSTTYNWLVKTCPENGRMIDENRNTHSMPIGKEKTVMNIDTLFYFRWMNYHLDNVGNTIVFFAALFSVIYKDTLNPSLIGMSVSFSIQVRR